MAKITSAGATRRQFLTATSALAFTVAGGIAKPYVSRAGSRPIITHGIQSGDVSADSAVVWARADRAARMVVEASTTDSFKDICDVRVVDALPKTDFTAKALLRNLPPGKDIFYRVRFENHSSPTIAGESQVGQFCSAPNLNRPVSFVWSGDCGGQGWGIDESRGGMRTFATMLRNAPDFFIHCGDSIYADDPIPLQQKVSGGEIWKNLVTEEKSKVAETLSDYRGNYKYNLLDGNVRAFNAKIPMLAQWDDHEVSDDWCPGQWPEWDSQLLERVARGRRAFHEFKPIRAPLQMERIHRRIPYGPLLDVFLLDMRSYRTPNGKGEKSIILGADQLAWLKRELLTSSATWKVIASDQPLGVVTTDSVGGGDGPPDGRELEIADLLRFIKGTRIRNTVWFTADLHYTAAHYFDPGAAVFQEFEPFWEFISGPLHAGTWLPRPLDNTFGPRLIYQKACSEEQGENLPPCFGMQFFGHVAIDGESEVMTVTLKDVDDRDLWSTRIEPHWERCSGGPRLIRS
jgi:alkaline phosphatase D